MKKTLLIALGLAAVAGAQAQTLFTTGTLATGGATFNRLSGLTSLSGVGTSVFYEALDFTVSADGTYTLEMSSVNATPMDTYLHLYGGGFNASTPLTNILAINDDFTGALTLLPGPYSGAGVTATGTGSAGTQPSSRLSFALNTGTTYTAVFATFDNGEVGTYYGAIGGGPGTVTAVPEPASMAALGLGALALIRKRRNSK